MGNNTNEPIRAATFNSIQEKAGETGPYPESFIDRFMDFVDRLPGPYWLAYLTFFILQSLIVHVLVWIDGWLPAYTFDSLILLFPLWLWAPLAFMTYLKSVSRGALSSFSPLLHSDEDAVKRLEYEFTHMPSRSVVLSSIFWVVVYIAVTVLNYKSFYVGEGLGTFTSAVIMIEGLISFAAGSVIYYYSLRQLRLVNSTVKTVRQFNLYQLDPVYAFSRVTSLIGISWMLMLSLTLLVFPMEIAPATTLAFLFLQILLAAAAFVLPLWFVNRRLVAEKLGLLAEINRRFDKTSERLHRCLDENSMGEAGALNSAITGLKQEREVVNSIPTWPWRPGTLTGFLSAIVLPIALFILQLVIRNLLGA